MCRRSWTQINPQGRSFKCDELIRGVSGHTRILPRDHAQAALRAWRDVILNERFFVVAASVVQR
ncbi:hypothetical protein ACSSVV_001609 [Marinobacter sp. MBR-105]|jgi:hypothetical protein